jgi:EAL and modified HD-GYP domain-containing signal transduction protein
MSVPDELGTSPESRTRESAAPVAFVARQAIYDQASDVIAYELLYRHAETVQTALIADDLQATLHVIVNMALEIGLDRLSDNLPVHINYPTALLEAGIPPPFPASRVVIEVLESVRGSPAVLQGLAALRSHGFKIALDDFAPATSDAALLDAADCVKLDISQFSNEALAEQVKTLKARRLTVIAEHVETTSEFERCRALGFDAYQGYYLQHPQTFSARPIPSNRLAALRLIATLQRNEPSFTELARLVSQDLPLSYQLLRCINSSYYGFSRKVESIRQAIVMLGFEKLRQLCALVALRQIENRPQSVFLDAMVRAQMCEKLGTLRKAADPSSLFITGLFSTLDALTGMPMSDLLKQLPLSSAISQALLIQGGRHGVILREVIAWEHGTWRPAAYSGLTAAQVQASYLESVAWAHAAHTMMSG